MFTFNSYEINFHPKDSKDEKITSTRNELLDLFSQFQTPRRREKIKDKIQNWERQNATRK